jgi:hypothetical protein
MFWLWLENNVKYSDLIEPTRLAKGDEEGTFINEIRLERSIEKNLVI